MGEYYGKVAAQQLRAAEWFEREARKAEFYGETAALRAATALGARARARYREAARRAAESA